MVCISKSKIKIFYKKFIFSLTTQDPWKILKYLIFEIYDKKIIYFLGNTIKMK